MNGTDETTGLATMRSIVTDVSTLAGWGVKGAIAMPLADFILAFGPPWPKGMPILTSLLEIVALAVVVSYVHGRDARVMKRALGGCLVLAAFAFAVYLALVSGLVHEAPDGTRLVAGYTLRADVEPLITEMYPPFAALRDANYDAREVWTAGSITVARLSLVMAWALAFCSFVGFLGIFAMSEKLKAGQQPAPKSI